MANSYLKIGELSYGLGYAAQSIGKPCIFIDTQKNGQNLKSAQQLLEAIEDSGLMYQLIDGGRAVFRGRVEKNFPAIQEFGQLIAGEYGTPPFVQVELAGRGLPGEKVNRWINQYMLYVDEHTQEEVLKWYRQQGSSFCFQVLDKDELLDYALKYIYKYDLPFERVYIETEQDHLAQQISDKGFTVMLPTYLTYKTICI